MDALHVVFVLCFAGVLAGPLSNDAKPSASNTCLVEYGIDPEIYGKEDVEFTDKEIYCPVACVYRDMGIMKPDGTIDLSKVEEVFKEKESQEKKVFYAVHESCKDENIACELASCMFKELKNHLGKLSISVDDDKFTLDNDII